MKSWSVQVNVDGENVLFISDNELSGVDMTPEIEKYIRLAAENLSSFVGKEKGEEFFPDRTPDGECTCACIDCIEGNHCGGQYWWPTGDNGEEELVGECKHIDGILNSMEENGMFKGCDDDEEEEGFPF